MAGKAWSGYFKANQIRNRGAYNIKKQLIYYFGIQKSQVFAYIRDQQPEQTQWLYECNGTSEGLHA